MIGTVTFVWQYEFDENTTQHHDLQRLDNGNKLILGNELKMFPPISHREIKDDFIIEVNPEGQIVWDWYTSEHFAEFEFSEEEISEIFRGRDWSHTNSIQALPANAHSDPSFAQGNILLSQRKTNTIFL